MSPTTLSRTTSTTWTCEPRETNSRCAGASNVRQSQPPSPPTGIRAAIVYGSVSAADGNASASRKPSRIGERFMTTPELDGSRAGQGTPALPRIVGTGNGDTSTGAAPAGWAGAAGGAAARYFE